MQQKRLLEMLSSLSGKGGQNTMPVMGEQQPATSSEMSEPVEPADNLTGGGYAI
jgi:hypothetical protein